MTTPTVPTAPSESPAAVPFPQWAAATDQTLAQIVALLAGLTDPPAPTSAAEVEAVIAFLRQHRLDAGSSRKEMVDAAALWSAPVKAAAAELHSRCCWNFQSAYGALARLADAQQLQLFSPALFGWSSESRHSSSLEFVKGTTLGRYDRLPADHFLRTLIRADECVQHEGVPHLDLGLARSTDAGWEPVVEWWYAPSVAACTRAEVAAEKERQANRREHEEQDRRAKEEKERYRHSLEGRLAALEQAKREREEASYQPPSAWR